MKNEFLIKKNNSKPQKCKKIQKEVTFLNLSNFPNVSYLQQAPPPQSAIEVGMAPGGQGSEYAEGQKIVKIRKVYQRSVVTPFLNLESVWRDYSQWEQNINPTIAKKMVDDRQRDFQVAKKVARELDQLTRGLNRNAPALPPSGGSSTDEKRQVDMWRKIIEWEKCNNCKSPDPAMVIKRVIFTYEQCLQCMAHHATIWYEAADYMIRAADLYRERNAEDAKLLDEQTQKLFERAIADDSPVRASKLLHFKYAEFQEKMRRYRAGWNQDNQKGPKKSQNDQVSTKKAIYDLFRPFLGVFRP